MMMVLKMVYIQHKDKLCFMKKRLELGIGGLEAYQTELGINSPEVNC